MARFFGVMASSATPIKPIDNLVVCNWHIVTFITNWEILCLISLVSQVLSYVNRAILQQFSSVSIILKSNIEIKTWCSINDLSFFSFFFTVHIHVCWILTQKWNFEQSKKCQNLNSCTFVEIGDWVFFFCVTPSFDRTRRYEFKFCDSCPVCIEKMLW